MITKKNNHFCAGCMFGIPVDNCALLCRRICPVMTYESALANISGQDIHVDPIVGMYPRYKQFDNKFFGVHPKLNVWSDPLAKVGFERSFEAIIDAGKLTFTDQMFTQSFSLFAYFSKRSQCKLHAFFCFCNAITLALKRGMISSQYLLVACITEIFV